METRHRWKQKYTTQLQKDNGKEDKNTTLPPLDAPPCIKVPYSQILGWFWSCAMVKVHLSFSHWCETSWLVPNGWGHAFACGEARGSTLTKNLFSMFCMWGKPAVPLLPKICSACRALQTAVSDHLAQPPRSSFIACACTNCCGTQFDNNSHSFEALMNSLLMKPYIQRRPLALA